MCKNYDTHQPSPLLTLFLAPVSMQFVFQIQPPYYLYTVRRSSHPRYTRDFAGEIYSYLINTEIHTSSNSLEDAFLAFKSAAKVWANFDFSLIAGPFQ